MKPILSILIFIASYPLYSQSVKDTLLEIYHTDVYFGSNDYQLTETANATLIRLKDTMPNVQGKYYFIESHTDSDGSIEFNKLLSENRSLTVLSFLTDNGIPTENIQSIAYGKLKPQATNKTETGKSLNRRTKISVQKRFKLRKLTGKIVPEDGEKANVKITIEGNIFKEVVDTDTDGNFAVWVPLGQRLLIGAESKDYFAPPLDIVVKDEIFIKPLQLPLIAIKPNAVLNFKEINFEGDKANVLKESLPSMRYLLAYMQKNAHLCFEIAGHINQPGAVITFGHRYELAIKRANTIYDYLIKGNIDPKRMYFSGYSNAQMKYPTPKTEEEQKANRRVEVIIKDCGEVERR